MGKKRMTFLPMASFGYSEEIFSKIGLEGFVIGAMTMIGFLTGYHQDGALLGSTYAFGALCQSFDYTVD